MLTFLRESRDEDTVCDVYLKKIIHHTDSPVHLAQQKTLQEDHHHHHHKKVKWFHREFIRKLFKIPKNSYDYNFRNCNNNNNSHVDRDEVDIEAGLPSRQPRFDSSSTGEEFSDPSSDHASPRHEGCLKWSTREVRVLKYCTLKGLTRSLTAHDTGDLEPSVVHVFLATFRSHSTVTDVLRCLIERYAEVKKDQKMRSSVKENALKSLKMVFLMWLYLYPSDFSEPTGEEQEVTRSRDVTHGTAHEETKENEPVRMLTEFFKANLNDHESIDKQLATSVRAVAANQNLTPPTPIFKLSCNYTSYIGEDFHPESEVDRCGSRVADFDDFSPTVVAELLTRMDADLFRNVLLHQCLGSAWGKRNRPGNSKSSASPSLPPSTSPSLSRSSSSSSSTVQATVEQFNALVYRVMTCILDESLTLEGRAKVIERWIGVAQECRRLKNFSSLKAILSALQSSSVHRLSHTWSAVDRSYMSAFHNLAVLMSDVDNHKLCRDVLEKEGTGKSKSSGVTLKVNRKKQIHANRLRIHKSHGDLSCPGTLEVSPKKLPSTSDVCSDVRCEGTVPFLGTFLTDLTMIDTAHKDYVDRATDDVDGSLSRGNGLELRRDFGSCDAGGSDGGRSKYINFSKKHKEWEVLVRVEILQKAASLYRMQPDVDAFRWLQGLPVYRETDYYKMSLRLQDKSSPALSSSSSPTPTTSTPTSSASPTAKSSSLLASSRVFSSVVSLDSMSSESSSSSSSSSSLHSTPSTLTMPSPFCKSSRLSNEDDKGVVLLKFNNTRMTFL